MPVLLLFDRNGDITVDGDLPLDICEQFGFVKHTKDSWLEGNKRQMALWLLATNREKSDKPLVTTAYVLSALMDVHGYKIVGQTSHGQKIVYAMAKEAHEKSIRPPDF